MTVGYAIRPAEPGAHLFHITVTVKAPDPEGQRFMLPAWIPGSYMIREFARHIVRISALSGARKVDLQKLDKHTWRAEPVDGELTLAYEVLELPADPGLAIVTYSAEPGSVSEARMEDLRRWSETRTRLSAAAEIAAGTTV